MAVLGLAAAFLSAGTGCSCSSFAGDPKGQAMVRDLRAELKPLPDARAGGPTERQEKYLAHYGIRTGESRFAMGTVRPGDLDVACQLYHTPGSRGTVLLMHGYLDHVGRMSHLINHLLAEGYSVATYDQPGHGLSAGRRVSVTNFGGYRRAFASVLQTTMEMLPGPYHAVGHSFGATMLVDHLTRQSRSPLRGVVLLAPLVQDAQPLPLQVLGRAVAPILDYVPRVARQSSSDPAFEWNLRNDPLRPACVSTRWTRAQHRWRRETLKLAPVHWPVLVINAEVDDVVDVKYGTKWLTKVLPEARFRTIENERHQLLNGAAELRVEVMETIVSGLR